MVIEKAPIVDNGNKYIYYELKADSGKTQVWKVVNKNSRYTLAIIKWYGAWRQYVIEFDQPYVTTFNNNCLLSVVEFLNHLNKEKRIVVKESE